jgi:hypothetical protein
MGGLFFNSDDESRGGGKAKLLTYPSNLKGAKAALGEIGAKVVRGRIEPGWEWGFHDSSGFEDDGYNTSNDFFDVGDWGIRVDGYTKKAVEWDFNSLKIFTDEDRTYVSFFHIFGHGEFIVAKP